MKRFLDFLLVPVLALIAFFGPSGSPLGGSDRTPPVNFGTVAFEHMLTPRTIAAAVLVTLGLGAAFAAVSYTLGTTAAVAFTLLFLALGMPKAGYSLGALSAARNTDERSGDVVQLDMAAAKKIYQGSLVAVDSSGNANPAADTSGFVCIGRAEQTVDNTSGSAADLQINVKRGVFLFANSESNALTKAHIGTIAYAEDDQTVASTGNNSVKAGLVVAVTSAGVWIDTRFHLPTAGSVANSAITTAKLADAVADQIFATTVAVANTGTPDGVAHITGQVQDAQGNSLTGRFLIRVFIDDAAYTAVEDLGTLTAAAGSLLLKETTDDAYVDVLTAATGAWGIDLDTTIDGTIHAHATVVGKFATANAAITGNA